MGIVTSPPGDAQRRTVSQQTARVLDPSQCLPVALVAHLPCDGIHVEAVFSGAPRILRLGDAYFASVDDVHREVGYHLDLVCGPVRLTNVDRIADSSQMEKIAVEALAVGVNLGFVAKPAKTPRITNP